LSFHAARAARQRQERDRWCKSRGRGLKEIGAPARRDWSRTWRMPWRPGQGSQPGTWARDRTARQGLF